MGLKLFIGILMASYCYFTFSNMYRAFRAEGVLKETACSFRMVPVPRFLGTGCGIALRCRYEEAKTIRDIRLSNQVKHGGIYCMEEKSRAFPC